MSGSGVDGRTSGYTPSERPSEQTTPTSRFCYELVDLAGRALGRLERRPPLRADDTVQLEGTDAWRVVAVLGRTATVVRSTDTGT